MKIYYKEVSNCLECPGLAVSKGGSSYVCNEKYYHRTIGYIGNEKSIRIPDWCPLEDKDEKTNN